MEGIRINIQNLILSQKLEAQVYFWTNLYAIQFLCSLFKIRTFVQLIKSKLTMIFGRIYCVIELITDIGHLHASVQLKLKCRDLSTHIRFVCNKFQLGMQIEFN